MTTLSDAPAVRERPILFSGDMVTAILEGRKTQTRRVVKPQPPTFPFGVRQIVPVADPFHRDAFAGTPAEGMGHTGPRETAWYCEDYSGNLVARYDMRCPYGAVGDRLWVKETWQSLTFWRERHELNDSWDEAPDPRRGRPVYRAGEHWDDDGDTVDARGFRWRPAIHMPRWASRITLEITGVRVERLQDITDDDARAEGMDWAAPHFYSDPPPARDEDPREVGYGGGSFARDNYSRLWDLLNAARGHPWDANPWVWVLTFRRLEATA